MRIDPDVTIHVLVDDTTHVSSSRSELFPGRGATFLRVGRYLHPNVTIQVGDADARSFFGRLRDECALALDRLPVVLGDTPAPAPAPEPIDGPVHEPSPECPL